MFVDSSTSPRWQGRVLRKLTHGRRDPEMPSPSGSDGHKTITDSSSSKTATRRELSKTIRSLSMPEPFSIELFIDLLSEQRDRPIKLLPMSGFSGMGLGFGVWAVTDLEDRIVYEADTTPLHQAQIVGHEVGHMLACHEPKRGAAYLAQTIMPNLDLSLVSSALLRVGYSDEQEKEAELAGSMILRRALATYDWQPLPAGSRPESETYVRVLGGRRA